MKVFKNGNVFTANNKKFTEGFCIENGKFTFVGANCEFGKISELDDVIDLKGKTIVPGFNDAHMHFLNYAVHKNSIKLSNITSIKDMIKISKEYIKEGKINEGKWIIAQGWNDNLFEENRMPNRFDLDKISTKHPIFFSRICNHIGTVNSKALEMLNIDKNSINPEGGIIDKDNVSGEPTGILRENALNLIFDKLPSMSVNEIKEILLGSFEDALRVGLTSIQTEDVGHAGSLKNLLRAYKELDEEKKLPLKVTLQLLLPDKEAIGEAENMGLKTGMGSEFLKIGPLKLLQDGSLGGRTAAMQEVYCDADTKGVTIYTQEKLNELIKYADSIGLQIAVHAIGDEAMNMVLDAVEGIRRRPVIIHCQFTNTILLERFKNQNVIADVQPSFVMTDWAVADKAVGEERSRSSYAWKSILDLGIPMAFSSDAPIESFNPMLGIYAAVTRKNLKGFPKCGWHTKQCISVEDAVIAFTLGSAYMSFEENVKGSIEVGKAADFVILSKNIFEIDPEEIKDVYIEAAYVNGKKVYEK